MSAIKKLVAGLRPGGKVVLRYVCAVLIVAVASGCADIFSRITGTSRLTSIFLSSVLLVAFYLGAGPGYVAAFVALIAHLYMVDPPYKLSLGSVDEFNALSLFMAASILTCLLAGRIREESAAARNRARTTAALLEATREFSATSDEGFIREQLSRRLHLISEGDAMVREGLRLDASPGSVDADDLRIATVAERSAKSGRAETTRHGDWSFRGLVAGEHVFGVAGWRAPRSRSLTRDEQVSLELLADTGAAAIARARVNAAKAEAETRARTEDLRNALLSSISHDLRTPLSAIMASASSLNRFADTFDVETRRDLASTIEEEAARLDAFVSNLLQMTRLQSGAVPLKRVAFGLPESIQSVMERHRKGRRIEMVFTVQPRLADGLGDPLLFEQAFGNVVENAIRYAGSGPIEIDARACGDMLQVEIADHGPGVPEEHHERIFEKFFRSSRSEKVAGTGLGLSITRGLLEAMGGGVVARGREGASGLIVQLTIPSARP